MKTQIQYYEDFFKDLKEEMENVAGNWNGDDSGYREEQAMIAYDIIEKSNEIVELIRELNGTN